MSFDKKLACLTNYQERRSFPWPLVHLYFDYEFGERLALKMPFDISAKGTVFSEQARFTGATTHY